MLILSTLPDNSKFWTILVSLSSKAKKLPWWDPPEAVNQQYSIFY